MYKKAVIVLSVAMIIGGGISVLYGLEAYLPRQVRKPLPNIGFLSKVRVQETTPTADWSAVQVFIHEEGPGSPVITDEYIKSQIDLAGAKAEPYNQDEWGSDYSTWKFYDPGEIIIGDWPTGVKYRGPDMSNGEVHIYNYNSKTYYNYPPKARCKLSKVDDVTVKCDGANFGYSNDQYPDDAHSSWPMASAELTLGPPTTGIAKYMFNDFGTITEYKWKFDDGTTKTREEVNQSFATSGEHEITLTVTDSGGKTDSVTKIIDLGAPTYELVVKSYDSPSLGEISVDGGMFDWSYQVFYFKEGTTHTLEARGFSEQHSLGPTEFQDWTGDINRIENPTTITLTGDMTVLADFAEPQPDEKHTVNVDISPSSGGQVIITRPDGTTATYSSSFSEEFSAEANIELSAIPASGYSFDSWSGDIYTEVAETGLSVSRNMSITANFKDEQEPSPTYYNLDVNSTDGGHVEPGDGKYKSGESVILRAVPDSSYEFDHWSGDVSGTGTSQTITMNEDKQVKAHFTEKTQTYDINKSVTPSEAGSISLNPERYSYPDGTEVTARVIAYEGYEFSHWDGDVSGDTDSISFTVHSNMNIEAMFSEKTVENTYTLTTRVASGQGTVSPTSVEIPAGRFVTVNADPAEDYYFSHWGGDASGMENPKVVKMTTDKTIQAYFAEKKKNEHVLTMKTDPGKGGSITAELKSEVTGQAKTAVFAENAEIVVTATASRGYEFEKWTGSASGTDPTINMVMNMDKTVVANFKESGKTVNMPLLIVGIVLVLSGIIVMAYLVREKR